MILIESRSFSLRLMNKALYEINRLNLFPNESSFFSSSSSQFSPFVSAFSFILSTFIPSRFTVVAVFLLHSTWFESFQFYFSYKGVFFRSWFSIRFSPPGLNVLKFDKKHRNAVICPPGNSLFGILNSS